jgi:hypothetical protein
MLVLAGKHTKHTYTRTKEEEEEKNNIASYTHETGKYLIWLKCLS